jgi:serine/threonine protein phosphatase PrpC
LCSDGLNKEMSDQEIALVLAENDYKSAAELLVETSLERGARDNVTVAVVEFLAEEDTTVTL